MTSQSALKVEQVHKKYHDVVALRGVSFSVEPGQIFGLLGENGAGKTTLIRLLVGSIRPHQGRLEVLGLDPYRQARAVRQRIGYMPQERVLYEDLSVSGNIQFFGRAHEVENLPHRVDEVMEFVGLQERAKDSVFTLSGGMRQRLSLACALVHEPEILLLDEPSSGVDLKLRESFWRHFRDLAARGVSIVVSTHQMDEALYCDQLAVIRAGDLLANDTPRNLLWRGETRVKIWQGGQMTTETLPNAPEQLPILLQRYGLDKNISRIEVEEDSLEAVLLKLISQTSNSAEKEA